MKIGIITSRTAKAIVKEVVKDIPGVEVVELPIPVISILSTKTIAKIVSSRPEILSRLRSLDYILVPGIVRGDTSDLERLLERPVYKATRDIGGLPYVIKSLQSGVQLDKTRPAEDVLGRLEVNVVFKEAFSIGSLKVPLRGPPILIISEIHPFVPKSSYMEEASRIIRDKPDILLIGAHHEMPIEELSRRVTLAYRLGAKIVLSEAPTRMHAKAALDAGALGLSLSAYQVNDVIDLLEGNHTVIIGERSLDQIRYSIRELTDSGLSKIIVDPVLGLPLIDFVDSITRYSEALKMNVPLMFSAANVTEEVEADTPGIHGVLATLAVELRTSLYLVVEETYKSRRGTLEAKEALRLATIAWARKSTERGLYSGLLMLKQATPPVSRIPDANPVQVGYVKPVMDKRGYIEVYVNHEKGVIGAVYREYRDNRAVKAVEGKHATSVARALIRAVGLDPEHSAYLGYELAKAEMALKLGKTYTQDEPVIIPLWERGCMDEECNGERSC
ncbi:MAG: dihydropteroate synthase-like protein [Desulfurococcales archaeon]|nr:dihydropteroate synthase-like protein [Desulfurococcales archaeon]